MKLTRREGGELLGETKGRGIGKAIFRYADGWKVRRSRSHGAYRAESEATSSARLWDDSMIPPEDTRKVLALGLSTMLGGCPLEQIDLWCLQHAPAS